MTQAPSIKEALELLPCPFCGKQPQSRWHGAIGEDDDSGYWGIDCCQAFSHDGMQEDAVNKWNTRAALATLQPSGERREAIARIIEPHSNLFVDPTELASWNEALAKADQILASGLVQDETATSKFKPCFLVNEQLNLIEVIFEDVSYTAKPLLDGVYHWIDQHIAHDDGRVVGLTFWIYKPPKTVDEADWRDISTAPKDGSYIIAGRFREDELKWVKHSRWMSAEEACEVEGGASADDYDAGWTDGDDDGDYCYPTHWMPLPTPPSAPPATGVKINDAERTIRSSQGRAQ